MEKYKMKNEKPGMGGNERGNLKWELRREEAKLIDSL